MSATEIRIGYLPGIIGRITELHGIYYQRSWNFGSFFEAKVASELSNFINRYNENRDCLWSVWLDGWAEAAIVIDGIDAQGKGAHLRWFIVADPFQGTGIGTRLIQAGITFCREKNYSQLYLWTFKGLDGARHLYEKHGFSLAEQRLGKKWGTEVTEQRFELILR